MSPTHPSACGTSVITLLALLLVAGSAGADPTIVLDGVEDLSGSEVVIYFDDLGLVEGDDIPALEAANFLLTNGSAAKYTEDPLPREFGPTGPGSIANFSGVAFPYPDLSLGFTDPVHTLGFGLRASSMDTVQVTFRLAGTLIDQVTVPSRGEDQLYFYGFQNDGGFDEVLIDVVGNPFLRTGAFTFDNLTFDSPNAAVPALLTCVGFESPIDTAKMKSRNAKFLRLLSKAISSKFLKARLLDADGIEVVGGDLIAPPVVQVSHSPAGGGDEVDVTADIVWGDDDRFAPAEDGSWWLQLERRSMRGPGTYRFAMRSGDELEYVIEPTCEKEIVRSRLVRRRSAWRHWVGNHSGRRR